MRKWDYRGERGGGWVIRMVIFLSCLCFFVFLFLLTYPRLTLIITGKKFFPFKIAITPSSFHRGSQTVLELQLFLLHVLCLNQDNYQECGHFLCYRKLCHLHTCLSFYIKTLWYHTHSSLHQNSPDSLRASSLGCSGGGAGKGRRACNYIRRSGIWISASKKSMRNADWKRCH